MVYPATNVLNLGTKKVVPLEFLRTVANKQNCNLGKLHGLFGALLEKNVNGIDECFSNCNIIFHWKK